QPVGRTVLIDEEALSRADGPLICSNFCRLVRLHREVDPEYVHLVLTFQYLCGRFDEFQTQTTNIRNLNFNAFLSGIILQLPPRAEQRRIVAKVRELQTPVQRARKRLAKTPEILRRFRQAVLSSAFAGRLTESWREGRTASGSLDEKLREAFKTRCEAWEMAKEEAEAFDRRAPRRPKNLATTQWEAPEPLEAPEVPEGWRLVALHDVVHRAQYGISTKADADKETGVAMLRMANIQDGRIAASDLKYIDPEGLDVPGYTVRRGDILFNRTNSPELVGKAAVFNEDLEAVFASYLVRVECDERLIDSRYLCWWINSPWGRRWARTVRTESVSQSNINISRLVTMPVPFPPLEEQRLIVELIEKYFAYAAGIERKVASSTERAEKLWKTIMVRALRGELAPNEAEVANGEGRGFEPASELLDRISAERLAASQADGEGVSRKDDVSETILAAIRQSCWGAGKMTCEELIGKVATRLECRKLGKSVRARLDRHVEVALERKIVEVRDGLLCGATPTFARYDWNFLVRTVRILLKDGQEHGTGDLISALAAYLGYGQVTVPIRERMERILLWASQNGLVELRDGKVKRTPSPPPVPPFPAGPARRERRKG
ncbi:MAG TPA: restriction endonuclease subunit S, partial [Thermoanaerobaculia bacterium]